MHPCLRPSLPLAAVKQSLRAAFETRAGTNSIHRSLSTRLHPAATTTANNLDQFQDDEFPMKLAHYIQKRSDAHQQHLQARWKKLARLTFDPKIANVSQTILLGKQNIQKLPTTLTQVVADTRPCIILRNDEDDILTIVNVNQAWCQLSGFIRDEVLNQRLSFLFPDKRMQILVEQAQYGSSSTSSSGVVTHYTRDGRKCQDRMRFGTIAIAADVSNPYIVCVLET